MRQRDIVMAAYRFEEFCENLFRELGTNPKTQSQEIGRTPFDFNFSTEMGEFFVEVKVRSSQVFNPREADRIYQNAKHLLESDRQFLVIILNVEVPEELFDDLNSLHNNLLVIDANVLWRLSEFDEDVLRDLQSALSSIQPFSGRKMTEGRKIDGLLRKIGIVIPEPSPAKEAPINCKVLKNINPGKADAKLFEKTVTEALKHLFDGELTAWSEQERSDTGMSINDLIARNNSAIHFWRTLRDHFESVYVIFEFKNYSQKVRQTQIYTTERYLYRSALRNAAIVISPQGMDENAKKAARGALREHGKLILDVTIDNICEMLTLLENGDEPSIVLSEILDIMLMKIER
ncbi:hypothetical protein KUV73_24280 [Mameliella alba]|nr:hypothetical protein [Mameliella alba]MBY6172494.1 hypothetical protein [Mameliella alba]MBY6177508.1 hypothetical protein [Mameliella alba]